MKNKKLASAIVSSLIITSLAGTPVLAASVSPTNQRQLQTLMFDYLLLM